MKQIAMSGAALVLGTTAALAGSASVGPVTCWSAQGMIEMQDCSSQSTADGGSLGRCTIITTASDGRRIVTKVAGIMRPWGGTHTIHKAERSLKIRYERGKFTCSFTPSGDYVVGDCSVGAAGGACTIMKRANGSNQYFRASASAHPD
jgi:hypothetical protein